MGHRERNEAQDRAIKKGEEAYAQGLPLEANPYKRPTYALEGGKRHLIGGWSLWPFWKVGWEQGREKSRLTNPTRLG